MGKEKNFKDGSKAKEIFLTRKITENDIEDFNKMVPLVIILKNTKGQDPNILSKLSSNVTIRVLGGFDDSTHSQFAHERFLKKTSYSPAEICKIIQILEAIEKSVDPKWSDLEKSTYVYISIMSLISPTYEDSKNNSYDERPLAQILTGKADSTGYAFLYKELLDRLGIACRYMQNDLPYSWNEVLIDDQYYPADLFSDTSLNEDSIKEGRFELKSFLSDKEFYYKPEHKTNNQSVKNVHALDHSEIQKAIDKILHPEKNAPDIPPKISLKSKAFQEIFKTSEIKNADDFNETDEIRIPLTSQDVDDIHDDLVQIATYYPQALNNVVLSNSTTEHIDMQKMVDAIYDGRSNLTTSSNQSQIVIETTIPEDFDIDFSKAPKFDLDNVLPKRFDDISHSQKISFVNTSSHTIKLPSLEGKIPESIDTIHIHNCDVANFRIVKDEPYPEAPGVLAGVKRLELDGFGTKGIADINGLDKVISLSVNKLNPTEFDDVMNIAIRNPSTMPRLFDLSIYNQKLKNRAFFSEITNPNIVQLTISDSEMNNIVGLDALKNQLLSLYVYNNDFSINDLKKISEISSEKPFFERSFYGNDALNSMIDSLRGDIISEDTYNYLDSYLQRSGYIQYRHLSYKNYKNITESKKQLLKDFSIKDLEKVPYFIEDAELMRKILPYTSNPMMVKDLATFQSYLSAAPNYFEADYLKDGTLWLTKEQLNYLISTGKKIPQKICIKINTVSELDNSELSSLRNSCITNGLKLVGVNVFDDRCIDSVDPTLHNFDSHDCHLDTYEIAEYGKIRSALEELVDGITPEMSDIEKFAVVYHRFVEKNIEYDGPATNPIYSKEHAIYYAKMRNKSRNLSEGLIPQEGFDLSNNKPNTTIANRSVCAGYADIFKNALSLVDIPCILQSGHAEYNKITHLPTGGHEWNLVKMDGKWYGADAGWDSQLAAYFKSCSRPYSYSYALKGTNTFVHSGEYSTKDTNLEIDCHIPSIPLGLRNEHVEPDDYDQALLHDIFNRVRNGEIPPQYIINIPEDPDFHFNQTIDVDRIKDEYKRRKNDMLAKYYGDREYQRKYDEISARYRANEIEVTNGGLTYKTIQDYAEKEDDEKFLILGDYKNALERMTKYEAGATHIYSGNPDQVKSQYEHDKEYVETRNHTFDQHKNTQKDLATLGKYGETLPYIPRQTGILRNGLRLVGNAGIFTRNLLAPVYRFIGRNVAQPIHRLITRGKDASPYRNNPYHRFVARRDYFKDIAKQNDIANGKNHPIRNSLISNLRAMANYKKGNTAVLNAGAYDIQKNLKNQELQNIQIDFLNNKKTELESQITFLENEIANHSNASNLSEVQSKLQAKKALLQRLDRNIVSVSTIGKIVDIQTDAVSQTQHDIASKEVNTYRVTTIKGVAKLGIKKFVGPKIKDWLLEHSKQTVARDETYQTTIFVEKEFQEPSTIVPIKERRPYYDIEVDDLIENAKGKTVKMYRSVSGGNKGEIGYTINGSEVCTGFHFQDGSTWGTGYSSNVPLMTDQHWPSSFLDASNNLREDLTFSEIANAISNGQLSPDLLDDMTLQIGNKGWVYANELLDGVTKEVQVGTKVIEGAKHTELIPQLVNRTRTVYDVVDNERVIQALNTLGITLDATGKVDTVHNVAEILRPTTSNVKTNKKQPRKYSYDDSEFYR